MRSRAGQISKPACQVREAAALVQATVGLYQEGLSLQAALLVGGIVDSLDPVNDLLAVSDHLADHVSMLTEDSPEVPS